MKRIFSFWQYVAMWPYLLLKSPRCLFKNTYDVLSELTDDQDLIAVLCGQWGNMGLPPKQSTFIVHAMIVRHYLHGGYYPIGGSWKISESIIPKIQATGTVKSNSSSDIEPFSDAPKTQIPAVFNILST